MKILEKITDTFSDRLKTLLSKDNAEYAPDKISMGITTFENRFDNYFVPLLSRLKEYVPESEVIVAVNGEHRQKFNEIYRKRILEFISRYNKVYPVVFPQFRGLS